MVFPATPGQITCLIALHQINVPFCSLALDSAGRALNHRHDGQLDERCTSKRIEVMAPILAPGPKTKLWEILDICLRDQRHAWTLRSDGTYCQLQPKENSEGPETIGTQQMLMNLTRTRIGDSGLEEAYSLAG